MGFRAKSHGATNDGGAKNHDGGESARAANESFRLLLESADVNGDARVSEMELEALVQHYVRLQLEQRFRRLDRNADGRVSRAEVPKMDARRFARFDRNGDGGFTIAELSPVMARTASARCHAVLARLDADRDGVLSAADLGKEFRVAKLEPKTAAR